jgi:hypothetical protein
MPVLCCEGPSRMIRPRAVLGVPPDRLDNQVEFVRAIDLSHTQ